MIHLKTFVSNSCSLSPVAAIAASVKDQAIATGLEVGPASNTLVELALVAGIGIEAVGFASTESVVHAAGTASTGGAATGRTATAS